MVPIEYQFQAELVFLLATITFAVGWKLQERRGISAVLQEPTEKAAWAAYAFGLLGYLSLRVVSDDAGSAMLQELLRLFPLEQLPPC